MYRILYSALESAHTMSIDKLCHFLVTSTKPIKMISASNTTQCTAYYINALFFTFQVTAYPGETFPVTMIGTDEYGFPIITSVRLTDVSA